MTTVQPDYQQVLQTIFDEVHPLLGRGQVADYIPELKKVSPDRFGMVVFCLDGRTFTVGDADVKFSLQSITKLFALALAFSREGDNIWTRVGREPSGNPFNSLVQLEYECGIPRNPFINAGALVITDILASRYVQADVAVLQFMRMLSDEPAIDFDMKVALSEQKTANRNSAIAYFMKNFGNLHNDVAVVIETYCRQCSITMTCRELAKAGSFLAQHGTVPWSGQQILDHSSAKRLNALMLTCGILALLPGEAAIAVWSPGLDANGNSLAGTYALERFTTLTARSIF